jgi:hypothetical protein
MCLNPFSRVRKIALGKKQKEKGHEKERGKKSLFNDGFTAFKRVTELKQKHGCVFPS